MTAPQAVPMFGPDRLRIVAELESFHFWFSGRRALIERLLDRHLARRVDTAVDVGAGTGTFLSVLARYADHAVGVDPLGDGTRDIVCGVAEELPFRTETVDLVTALDVLEHGDDDAAVREVHRVLRPNGVFIATVPAFPRLWSRRDDLAGHRRRYRRGELVSLLSRSGFDVLETAYFQFFLFPLVVASRAFGSTEREERPPARVNRVLAAVNAAEVRLGSRLRWPFGSTVAIVARKHS